MNFLTDALERIRIALVVLVIGLTAIAATGYAVGGNPLNGLFNLLGVKQIAPQFSDYHQSRSIDGYTITIQKAYADANRVLIGYTTAGPAGTDAGAKFGPEFKLTTEQGISLRPLLGVSTTKNLTGSLFAFDASSIQGTPKELRLHLAIPYGSQPPSEAFHTDGYLRFDFVAPFHPGNVLHINHSVTASGKTVTLEQIVITPSEVRAYIKGFTRFSDASSLSYTMTIDGKATYEAASVNGGSNVWEVNFDSPSLASNKGSWTLTIRQMLVQVNPSTGKYGLEPVPGAQWVFHFTVQ